jgi:hypothetical protein
MIFFFIKINFIFFFSLDIQVEITKELETIKQTIIGLKSHVIIFDLFF